MIYQRFNKFIQILRTPYYLQALFMGSAAGIEHTRVLQDLNCEFVVDIGANRGQFALVARKCFPNAFIHSVEPLDEPARIYLSIFDNDPKVTLHRCAIGSNHGTHTIHVSAHDDSSSLLPIGETQVNMYPGTQEQEIRTVDVRTLDELIGYDSIPNHSLLKVDVQGYELETLNGCNKLLNKFKYIYVEASFVELYLGQALAYEIIKFLADKRFILNGVYNVDINSMGKAIQADFFFTNQQCAS